MARRAVEAAHARRPWFAGRTGQARGARQPGRTRVPRGAAVALGSTGAQGACLTRLASDPCGPGRPGGAHAHVCLNLYLDDLVLLLREDIELLPEEGELFLDELLDLGLVRGLRMNLRREAPE